MRSHLRLLLSSSPFNLPIYLSLHANVKWRSFENFCRRRQSEREKRRTREIKIPFWTFFRSFVHHHHHHLFCGMFWKFFNLESFKFSLFWFYNIYFLKRRNELACGEIWVGGNDNFYCCWLRWWITAQRLVGIIVISIKKEERPHL